MDNVDYDWIANQLLNNKEILTDIDILKLRSKLYVYLTQSLEVLYLERGTIKKYLKAIGYELRTGHKVFSCYDEPTNYDCLIVHESIPPIAYFIDWDECNEGASRLRLKDGASHSPECNEGALVPPERSEGAFVVGLKEGRQTFREQFSNFNYVLGWDDDAEEAWNSALRQLECLCVPWNVEDFI